MHAEGFEKSQIAKILEVSIEMVERILNESEKKDD